ncbi:FAD-binding oxidoreductase [Jiangella mangrovi]|uniref:FAD/FMN-containing dehydrogenase n=1 Tax=Jiangella mangrovi TaxID=1524084 RepID=A0A7W9LP29_9ACTN|nr:FAD-binding protein [Jiangella mangrovi]MBB5790767.1 FAD/FMN-containing dehydrogenase [Jiangella mangrovi]
MNVGDDLRRTIRGRVLASGDDGFDAARRPWNLAVEQPVRAVVEAADADDVAATVRFARRAGLSVAAQPSGHGATGDVDGVILLRTGALNGVQVRPSERLACAGAGASWGAVLTGASPHGLTGLAGSTPATTVAGFSLGGGLSWFGRRFGFAANSVRSFDIVDSDGERATVTADSDADLFWALRGGGGDYALVTAIEFGLHPAPELYGGRMMWPAERAREVLAAYRQIAADAPDELTVWFDLLEFPDLPFLPDLLRGRSLVAVDSTYLGPAAEAEELLRPLDKIGGTDLDNRRSMPVADLGSICAEPTDPSPGTSRAELLLELDDTVAATLLDRPITPLLSVQLRRLGGALARPASDGGACGQLAEPYLLYTFGVPATPQIAAEVRRRQTEIAEALLPYTSGRKPFTFLAGGDRAGAAFPTDDLGRLRAIKQARDPHGVFRSNFPVAA